MFCLRVRLCVRETKGGCRYPGSSAFANRMRIVRTRLWTLAVASVSYVCVPDRVRNPRPQVYVGGFPD